MEIKLQSELLVLVESWMKNRGLLLPHQTLQVVEHSSVVARVISEDPVDSSILQKAVKRMRSHGVRISNMLSNNGLTPEVLRGKSLDDLFKYRNIGRLSLTEFANCLAQEGVQFPWMIELAETSTTRTAVEIENAKVITLTDVDWRTMIQSIKTPPGRLAADIVSVLKGLRMSVNEPTRISKIVNVDLDTRRYKTLTSLMNRRWVHDGLKYRAKVIPKPTKHNPYDATLQIVMID